MDWLFWSRKRQLNHALLDAVTEGKTEQVRLLLDQGASANSRVSYESALGLAGRSPWSNAATLRLLLERSAFVNGDPKRKTVNPLLRASHSSDEERIKLLITHGANVNAIQQDLTPGLTPLQELVKWADLETLALLLEHGADVNAKCGIYRKRMSGGFTALHCAASVGRPDAVTFLLKNGADIMLLDAQGKSALDYGRKALDQPYFRDSSNEKEAKVYQETIELLEKECERCPNH